MHCDFLSASRADVYERCTLQYYARYELGYKKALTDAINEGKLAHKALELYYCPDNNLLPEEAWERAIKTDFCSGFNSFSNAKKMFFDYVGTHPKEELAIIGAEIGFEFFLESGSAFHGYIDRMDLFNDDTILIIDYKTGGFVPTVDELREANQTNLYALWIYLSDKFKGIKHVKVRYDYIASGEERLITISKKRALEYKEYIDSLYHRILNDNDPKPRLNSLCYFCPYKTQCQEYKRLLELIAVFKTPLVNMDGTPQRKFDSEDELLNAYTYIYDSVSVLEQEKKFLNKMVLGLLRMKNKRNIELNNVSRKIAIQSNSITTCEPTDVKKIIMKHRLTEQALELIRPGDLEKLVRGNLEAKADLQKVIKKKKTNPFLMVRPIKKKESKKGKKK